MMHKNRHWQVMDAADERLTQFIRTTCQKEPASIEEALALQFTELTAVLCQGFRCGDYLYLNDATSENGAGEWAILNANTLRQIESITFSWCSFEKALAYILKIQSGAYDGEDWASHITAAQLKTPEAHGYCARCA